MATPKTFCAIVIDAPLVKSPRNQLQFSKIFLPNVRSVSSEGVYNGLFVASNLHNKFSNFGNQRSTALSSSDFGKSDGFQYSSRGVYMFKFFFFRKLVNSWILYREQVLKHFLST